MDALASSNPHAADALAAANDIVARVLGPRLAFLVEVPELLPLSLIHQLAQPGSTFMTGVVARLGSAGVQLTALARTLEGAKGSAAMDAASLAAFEQADEEVAVAAAAGSPRLPKKASAGSAGAGSRLRGY